jgi:hypothetical protein
MAKKVDVAKAITEAAMEKEIYPRQVIWLFSTN